MFDKNSLSNRVLLFHDHLSINIILPIDQSQINKMLNNLKYSMNKVELICLYYTIDNQLY